jgi:hypothetical protein
MRTQFASFATSLLHSRERENRGGREIGGKRKTEVAPENLPKYLTLI